MPKSNLPVVILVRPQLGENIGAVSRAMSNFGLSELRLVAPRDGWPNQRALDTASGGERIIEAAIAYPDFASAIADINIAYAATARPRDMEKRVTTPQEAMGEITVSAARVALVFGPERTGLENEEITLCDTLITIPTAPGSSSLNLAQSVAVLGYEWWTSSSRTNVRDPSATLRSAQDDSLSTKQDWQGLFDQLETYLDDINYYRVTDKKTVMWQNLRNMLLRGQWNAQEVRSFRGMLRSLWERQVKNK